MAIELAPKISQSIDSSLSDVGDIESEGPSEKSAPNSLFTLRQIALTLLQFQFFLTTIYLIILGNKMRSNFLIDLPSILTKPFPNFTKQYFSLIHLIYFAGVPLTLSIAMAIAVHALRKSRFRLERLLLAILILLSVIDSIGLMKMLEAIFQ